MRRNATSSTEISVPDILLQPGNCIPCSLWHISSQKPQIEDALGVADDRDNRYHAERGFRTYQQWLQFTTSGLFPYVGLPTDMSKPFLLHCENGGFAHCVSVAPAANQDVTIQDGAKQYTMPMIAFAECVHSGVDKSTCVSFQVLSEKVELDTHTTMLLELQAGADADSDDDESPAETCFVVDQEGQVLFQDVIVDSLEEEVLNFLDEVSKKNIRKIQKQYHCALCPFRSFLTILKLGSTSGGYQIRGQNWQI